MTPPETARLKLRELTLDDVDNLHSIVGSPLAMRWYPKVYSRAEAQEWIERQFRRYVVGGCGLWACELKATGEFVGTCGPCWQPVDEVYELEVGYLLVPIHWGQGYATEAARACLAWSFEHYPVPRVISLIRPENTPSWKVAQRNGLTVWKETMWHDLLHQVWRVDRNSEIGN
ncbi:GNAT family N-acetyltransferase [candidate division KSB1 bacterium]|nr:GNAT family N-acetyltransferase [candidate division KSB1 bacterium]